MTNFGKIIIGFLVAGLVIVMGWLIFSQSVDTDNIYQNEESTNYKIVYETEVDGPNDCSSFEKYDAEIKVCTYECDTEEQCVDIQNQIDQELSAWTEELEKDKEPVAEKKISKNTDAEASYKVSTGEEVTFQSGIDTEENRKIWEDIAALSPDNISDKYIETYEIFNSPSDDTLAFVDDEDGNGKWRVAVNLAGHKSSNEREQKATLIHELGHIITLNTSQVNPSIPKESCDDFFIDEGCANTNSYLNNFKNNFWAGVDKQDFDENKFVTEYATTNEVEDMAESFAFFVLGKKEAGQNEKEQKINSFYDYSELVAIRNSMRSTLSQDIVRARKAGSN